MRRVLTGLMMLSVLGCAKNIEERNWMTMGTTASVKIKHGNAADINCSAKYAHEMTRELEQLLSAHDAKSELSRLASCSDAEIIAKCNSKVRPCYEAAFKLRDQSRGAFNPRWKGAGKMDLGGIAKGYAVDVLADQLQGGDEVQALLDVGGNLKSKRGEWKVGVAGSDQTIILKSGEACATSAEYFRGKHIYDGRTGNAVTNDLLSVTVVHPSSAMLADGLSTICFILGEKDGEAFLRKFHPSARAIFIKK